ncbi:taste receptor type 1 member 2-like [Coregonus clupeaformis]|uniref:taste receptor type 1 member 2-like n=1 Tax=Coregonus clupeaformis TaxID=59861 RepID=UPI001E1C28BA|nr:taste receptor type 1 member 2-like [Coregonus clupeaformis]
MVYKAVYAIAHAIHSIVCEERANSTVHCDKNLNVKPTQVLERLRRVNFSRNGYQVSFDANGDPVATYELVNWQIGESGKMKFVTVGRYDASRKPVATFAPSPSKPNQSRSRRTTDGGNAPGGGRARPGVGPTRGSDHTGTADPDPPG